MMLCGNTDDTSQDTNPLYQDKAHINALYGRGYIAGIDMREQRKDSAFVTALMQKRQVRALSV
jgi:ATP-dependent RNA helicase DDX23/PRP28